MPRKIKKKKKQPKKKKNESKLKKKTKFKKKSKKVVKQKDKRDITALLNERVGTLFNDKERQEQEKKGKIVYIDEKRKSREMKDRKELDKNQEEEIVDKETPSINDDQTKLDESHKENNQPEEEKKE